MTTLLTQPQEMFIVTLAFLFLAALAGDLRHTKIFRSMGRMPDTRIPLDRATKLFMVFLVIFMTWAQDKDSQQSAGSGEWLSGTTLESMEGGSCAMTQPGESPSGVTWALLSGGPAYASNAVLAASQFAGGFACVCVTNIQPSALASPSNAVTFTNWPYAVARQAALLPPGCLPDGFTFGGRPVTNLYMAASGMLSFDAPKSSPTPATNGIPDGTPMNYMAVLQMPSDIVPTNGLFWYVPGTDSSVFTWKDVYLGRDTNCLATVQAELHANGDFTFRYHFPSLTNSYALITNAFLVGAQNNTGGETVLFTNSLLAVHPSFLHAFELRWKSLAGLNPEVADHDADGLTTADELFIHHTDPRRKDTDGDGLSDPVEIANATDPLNPDENNDGIPDGTDLTGYSLSDTNLVFKLINNIAPEVNPALDSDGDGWADWLELRSGTETNSAYSNPEGLDTLFSVTVSLASSPPVPGVLAVGTDRVMVTGSGSWIFWRTSGEAHAISFTAPRGATAPFNVTLGRPDAARYDKPSQDGWGGDFGKAALPLISFDPPMGHCCHVSKTAEPCETYMAVIAPNLPGSFSWEGDGTWATNAPNAVTAGHDVTWLRLRFTPSGASAYREAWAWVNTHCNAFTNALAGEGGSHIIYANTDNDDGDSTIDNADIYVENEDDLYPVTPYNPPQSCCLCPSHSPTNWTFSVESVSDNLRIYGNTNKTLPRYPGQQITPGQTVYVEGLVSSSTSQVDYVDWKMEGLTDDGSGGLVQTNIIIRSVYTVIDLKAAPVRLEPVTVSANEQGLILNPCGVATNGLAMYKVDVVPPGIVPDSAIHWSVASGDVDFYQSFDTGRTAIIRGGGTADSDFKLEVTVDGLPSTYKPYIFGRVLEPKTVQVRAYIICDSNNVAAVNSNTVTNWIAEANRIYRQVAMTFKLVSVQNVYEHDEWFEIGSQAECYQMFYYTNNTSGLELYCVKSLPGSAFGLANSPSVPGAGRGIAVRQDAPLMVSAHEIGHACGLDNIYEDNLDSSLISQEKAGALNWSGGDETGYYVPTLSHKRFISERLLMCGHADGESIDISLGPVRSKMKEEPYLDIQVNTGLLNTMNRTPEH